MPIASPHICPILVDREADLAALDQLLTAAAASQGQLVLLTGEAGAGKTRLTREVMARATSRDFQLILGQCMERDEDFPFAPIIDALRQQRMRPDGAFQLTDSPRELLSDLRLDPPLSAERSSKPVSPNQAKRRVFEAIGTWLAQLAEHQPVLLVLEDLHWADPTTLELLELLPHWLADQRLLILATARNDESSPNLQRTRVALRRSRAAVELTLPPLDQAGVRRMIHALTQMEPASSLVTAIFARTQGNPFFVEELMTTVPLPRAWLLGGSTIPVTVQETVLSRLADLEPGARDVAEVAAVIGQRFRFEVLLVASGLLKAEVLRVLRVLIDRGIVIAENSPGEGWYAFRHALTRDALYERILAPQRRDLHRVVADALQNEATLSQQAGDARDLGYHFHAAAVWPEALVHATRAGAAAERLHATVEALNHYRRALDAAVALDHPQAADLHRRCALALARLGAWTDAQAHFEAALALAQQRGLVDTEQAVAYDLAGLHASRDYSAARHWAQRAVDLAQSSGDRRREALALNRLGNVLTNLLRFEDGRRLQEDALAIFEAAGDQWGSADSLDLIGMARYLSGEVPEAREAFGRAGAIFSTLGDRERLASALTSRGLYLAVLDGPCATDVPPSAFAADAEQGLLLCQEIGWRGGEAYAQVAQACAALGEGRYADARQHATQAVAIANEIEHAQWVVIALLTLGILDASLCNWQIATEHFAQALTIACTAGAAQWAERLEAWIAYCDVRKGETENPLLTGLRQDSMPSRPVSIGQRRLLLALAERDLAQGKPDVALGTVERLLAGAAGSRPAEVVLLRAEILAALGRLDEADAGYLDARRIATEVGPRAVLWRVAGYRSDLWQSRNPTLAQAEAVLSRAEIVALASLLDDDSRRADFLETREVRRWVKPAGRRRTAETREAGGLTGRERDVAVEVAQGLSNKEIASALGISEKTVEMHVSSCLGKLGFVSRTQLATWVVSQDPLATP